MSVKVSGVEPVLSAASIRWLTELKQESSTDGSMSSRAAASLPDLFIASIVHHVDGVIIQTRDL